MKINIRSFFEVLLVLVVLYGGVIGCDASDDTEGRVQVLLTDAPLDDVLEAHVTIERVELVDSLGGTTILMDEPLPFDLLTLRNGVTAELANLPVLASTYHQLRLVVGDSAYVLLEDSTIEDLKIPSGETSGIKLMDLPDFEIAGSDDLVVIVVDFDAEDSFVKAGNSGKYIFRPVLKPLSIEINGVMSPIDSTAADTTGTNG